LPLFGVDACQRAACRARGGAANVWSGKATPEAVAIRSRRLVGSPRFCVSQARECARGLSRCSGTVEFLSSSWTPSLSGRVVVWLRERRLWDSDLLWWFGWSPQFFGFTCVVELQLDLSSVTARLRGCSCVVLSGLDTGVMNQ
ncbi:hypothetical protein Taro_015208, partial [Colocasia esculenta]|nr:hypothetical protein [Colocasia esculenta]